MIWSGLKILQHHVGEFELISPLDKEFSCLTLTNSQDLEGIEELVTALPDVDFISQLGRIWVIS